MIDGSRWLIEHLPQAEDVDRHMRLITQQRKVARCKESIGGNTIAAVGRQLL